MGGIGYGLTGCPLGLVCLRKSGKATKKCLEQAREPVLLNSVLESDLLENKRSHMHSNGLVCIVETWLDKQILDCEVCIDNYDIVRHDRNRQGGGVLFFVSRSFYIFPRARVMIS